MVSFNPSTGSKYASSSTPHPFPSPQTHVREPPDYTHFFFQNCRTVFGTFVELSPSAWNLKAFGYQNDQQWHSEFTD